MNFDSKKDIRFQQILAKIVGEAAAMEAAGKFTGQPGKEGKLTVLVQLRAEFFWVNCFHELYSADDKHHAYVAYKSVRDMRETQRFLLENPFYLESVDLSLCKAANSIRKEERASRSMPKPQQT